jgi:acetyl esterase/lipase
MSFAGLMFSYLSAKNDRKRDKGLTTPPDVERFDDIVYGKDRKYQSLDIYRPKGSTGKLPVIMIFHGGAWVYGDKELYQFYAMNLCQRGFAVVNFSYRLAPKNKFPAPFEDSNSVVTFMSENADKYGLDMQNVFAVGDSAGAHLLALYTAICVDPEYASHYAFRVPEGFGFRGIALNCGAYHLSEFEGDLAKMVPALVGDYLPGKGTPEEIALMNVDEHIVPAFPPVIYMTCSDDFLKEQNAFLKEALEKNGVEHEFLYYGDEENKLPHVFHADIRRPESKECNDRECAFFREHIL